MLKHEGVSLKFLRGYLDAIGIVDYEINTVVDGRGFLISLLIPKYNNRLVGVFVGKGGRNLGPLRHLLKVIGYLEEKNVSLIVKMKEGTEKKPDMV